ncbi:hypothetical protein [Bifidobacterium mongoliense]|uniref:hypothetical protein n=1 Tax=Bifidobacterium mongoliense TaxID=518643 RepID=UPI0030EE8E2F
MLMGNIARSKLKRGIHLLPAWMWMKHYAVVAGSLVFVVLFAIIASAGFDAINVHYTTVFNRSLSQSAAVEFRFDRVADLPDASVQQADVNGDTARIRLDPLNNGSRHLSIVTDQTGNGLGILRVKIDVQVGGRHLWNIYTIDGHDIAWSSTPGHTIFSFIPAQLSTIQRASRQRSEFKVFLLIVLTLAYAVFLMRISVFAKTQRRYFALGTIVVLVCIGFVANLWIARPDLTTSRFPYKLCITAILGFFLIWLGFNCSNKATRIYTSRLWTCAANYVAVAAYAVMQFLFYVKYYAHSYDEMAHLSYVAYEKVHNQLLPRFENMQIYRGAVNPTGSLNTTDGVQFNQLGHPPLYYLIMSRLPGMSANGDEVFFDLELLRVESFLIGLLGIALVFYIGFTRIRKVPLLHLLFALMIVSPPNLIFVMSGLNNDTLTFVTIAVFVLGCIRFVERRYNLATYVLIAFGICATLLTKLTAGMIVVVIAVLIVAYALIVDRNPKALLRKEFFISLPLYAVPLAYFGGIYARYHTVQPGYESLARVQYLNSSFYTPLAARQEWSVLQYLLHFWNDFINYWNLLPYLPDLQRPGMSPVSFESIALTMTLILPLVIFAVRKDRIGWQLALSVAGVWSVIVLQCYSVMKVFYAYGYLGGTQSRYYLCANVVFALAIIWLIERHAWPAAVADGLELGRDGVRGVASGAAGSGGEDIRLDEQTQFWCSCFCLMLVIGGFILSVLYHVPELDFFKA